MARPRGPVSELSPESVAHNKGVYAKRALEPKTAGELGLPSRWLSKDQKKIWKSLVRFSPAKLGESDRCLMEIVCVLKAKLEKAEIENVQITQLLSCLNKLGFIPHSREAIPEEKTPEPDEWAEL
jgi:phage terminase small subunit